jgi:hypothetical protein
VDVFEAQSILLTMCAAERLLTRDELIKLCSCLQQLQAAAVQHSSGAEAEQQLHQQLQLGVSSFKTSFKVQQPCIAESLLRVHIRPWDVQKTLSDGSQVNGSLGTGTCLT